MAKTIVGLYDDRTTAHRVLQDLENRGFGKEHLRFATHEEGKRHTYEGDVDEFRDPDTLANYGVPREEADFYAEGLRRGGALVIARVHDSNAEETADIMARHNPVRYEDRSAAYRKEGYSAYDRNAATYSSEEQRAERERYAGESKQRFQEIEEHLKVGKREAVRGGVRVHKHVDTNVEEETLRLREEHVDVDRRNVDRKLTGQEADAAFREDTVEVVERSEEPVVEKEARVTGEVAVGKDTNVREETVSGEVRSVRVDVEKIPSETYAQHDTAFRQHYDQNYRTSGQDYNTVQPAYRYGYAAGQQYSGRSYSEVEPHLQRDYTERYGDRNAWDKMKDAVRHGYERARS